MQKTLEKTRPSREKAEELPEDHDRWLEIFSLFVHDLESPLASIKYLLEQIAADRLDLNKPNHRRLVDSSRIALARAESILFDIMAVARAGETGLPVETTSLVPSAVIEEAVVLAEASAVEREIGITFTNNAGDIPVTADPKLLKRIMDNLIFNGLRHTPAGGMVSVYTEPGKKCVFIHVKDSGPGLRDIDPDQLFKKYGQVALRADGNHRGVGLGLYFCRLAASGMGGTVLAADHPKGGAVFSIKLMKSKE